MRLTTFGIPILIGVIAAGLNWYVLNQRDPAVRFLRVREKVAAGTVLTDDAVDVVELSGPPDTLPQLNRTVVQAADKGLVVGRTAVRDLQPNDLVLWRDFGSARGELARPALPISLEGLSVPERLLQVGDDVWFVIARRGPGGAKAAPADGKAPPAEPGFEEVGPFRVASVGDLTDRRGLDSREKAGPADRLITVEVEHADGKLPPKFEKLLAARVDPTDPLAPRVVAVVLHPHPAGGK